jgi:hypothetical protein
MPGAAVELVEELSGGDLAACDTDSLARFGSPNNLGSTFDASVFLEIVDGDT